jgi:sugar (pentulose or hexulose) kinase
LKRVADYQIAVLDVGKTNKKLFVYDSTLRCLTPGEKGVVIDEVEKDGLRSDDMASIYRWMLDSLQKAARTFKDIRVISISTHGATIALLGRKPDAQFAGDGGLAFPIVSYMQEIDAREEERFYRDMAMSPGEMQRRTGTARFGLLLNSAKQVWWLKERFRRRFAGVTGILMFPSYLAYLLTGKKSAEPTYAGCHGYLLDISGRKYSVVAQRLGILDKLPRTPFLPSWSKLGALLPQVARETGLKGDTIVTVGVHDSNAALVPYFAAGMKDFLVQDSGTWVVTMSPQRQARFRADEIGKEVFFNRSVYGGPVKTTVFRGGAEFDFYRTRVFPQWKHPDGVDEKTVRDVVARREAFSLPTIERGSGLFPSSVARLSGLDTVFRDAASAWCVVDLGLAAQGYHAIRMAAGRSVSRVIIEGNIARNNPIYRSAIAALMPRTKVFSGAGGGAALGAAILAAAAVEGRPLEDFRGRLNLDLKKVRKLAVDRRELVRYVDAFLMHLA